MSHRIRQIISHWRRRLFPPKTLGQRGEEAAARYLRRRRYKILARGHRFRLGELDLVALDGRTIVFVEVKTRESAEVGHPSEAVDHDKQRKLTQMALSFLKRHRLLEYPTRFDVIAITLAARRAASHDRTRPQRLRSGWGMGVSG